MARVGMVRKRAFVVVVVWILLPLVVSAANRKKWPHETSSLKPPEEIVWGTLDNGFRYALMPRTARPSLVSMRLLVGVGSLDEQEDERGLAHFIEHMAFKGTRNFKPGELIAFFQRLGMGYGVDVNAFTYHDKTVYHLELPNGEEELIEQSLLLYRDYADGILFDEDSVENERGVILREKQARDSPSSRISQASFGFSFDGTRLADRNPIGLEEVIRNVSVKDLRAFYRKWYRPETMTLVVVGDVDSAALEAQIAAAFSSMKSRNGRIPKRRVGSLSRFEPFRTGQLAVEGVERYTLDVSRAWMEPVRTDSWERRKEDALRSFSTSLFNERCRTLIDGMSNNFATYDRVYGIPYCQLTISSGGAFWWDAFVWMDQLMRQATRFGFTEDELEFGRRTWLRESRSFASAYESAEPRVLIDDLVESISQDVVYVEPEAIGQEIDAFIGSLDLEDVNAAFAEVWKIKRMSYFVAGDMTEGLDGKALRQRVRDDRKYAVLPFVPALRSPFEYTDLGPPGSVVESSVLEGIAAKTFRFSNNARLTFLRTDNERDQVRALVRVGGGMLSFTDLNPATHALGMTAMFRSGFGGHNVEEIYKELRSNVTSFVFGVDDHDAFTYRGLTQSDGIDEFLKIVAEYLLDPKIDPDAFALAKSKLKQNRELEPDGMNDGYRNLYHLIYPEMPRFHEPSLRDIVKAEASSIQSWMEEPLKSGYLEVAVVGDVDEEKLVELFAETIGALPERRLQKDNFAATRSLKIEAIKGKRTIEYKKGMGDNAASVIVWTIQEEVTLRESAALFLLSSVLESRIRVRVREEMGATYSPSVSYVSFAAYDSLRHIRADVDCLKGDAAGLLDVVLGISDGLVTQKITPEELKAAVAPLEEGIRQAWRDNAYLLENVLYGAQEYPDILDNSLKYKEGLLSSITIDELEGVARRFLKSEDALAVAIVPSTRSKLAEAPSWDDQRRTGAVE